MEQNEISKEQKQFLINEWSTLKNNLHEEENHFLEE
jgi:hypothetical protein